MYVACSTLCFGKYALEECLQTIRDLHFQKVDLAIHANGPHLTPQNVAVDPIKISQQLRATNLQFSALHVEIDAVDAHEAKSQLKAIGRLARLLMTPLVCVPAAPFGSDFIAEVERLTEWVKIIHSEGVMLTVETHRETITADPMGAIELCKRVPELGLTLDPSHYMVGAHKPDNFDQVLKYVEHTRLRDTGVSEDQFQMRVGQGQLEYGRLIGLLQRGRYRRALTVDIRDQPESGFPIEPEVRKLKYLLESLV